MLPVVSGAAGGAAAAAPTGNPWIIGGAAVLGGVMGYMSAAENAKTEAERQELLNRAAQEFRNIKTPEERNAAYQYLQSVGKLTPELEKTIQIQDTAMGEISVDPRLKDAQLAALAQLSELGKTGLTEADKAEIAAGRQQYLSESANQQAQIQESMARRGAASSGMEQVARQQAAQDAANQMNIQNQRLQGEARQRALQAIMQGGQLAGGIRQQEFGEQSDVARAKDAFKTFNAQNAASVQARNIEAINRAAAADIANRQGIAASNVGIANTAEDINRGAAQRTFENEMSKIRGATGFARDQSAVLGDKAKARSAMWSGLAGAAGQGIKGYADYSASQPKSKKDEGMLQFDPDDEMV
jgi:hypothetical protein